MELNYALLGSFMVPKPSEVIKCFTFNLYLQQAETESDCLEENHVSVAPAFPGLWPTLCWHQINGGDLFGK